MTAVLQRALPATATAAVAAPRSALSLLRFVTCGSVDDGKSTLIGRLLYESKSLLEDQLAAVEADSRVWGTQGPQIDFALLVDGLAAEREQGITIDVAYRFFSTPRRHFIVADTPGHEQYTRNMITGASTADVAVVLVDARKGLLTQTRRHSHLVALIGIRRVVLAVNKMDLVDYDQAVFDDIVARYREFAAHIGLTDVTAIPLSGLAGDNVVEPGGRMPWYTGLPLLRHLEECGHDDRGVAAAPLRLPVQWVSRPNPDFRGFCGPIVSGSVRPGDRVRVQPSGRITRIARIVAPEGDRAVAFAGESVNVTLEDEVDVSRGDMISAADAPAEVADQFECSLVWMADEAMLPGRQYWLKIGARTVGASFTELKYRLDVDTMQHLAARTLELNGIAVCNLATDQVVPFDPYVNNRDTGGFIVIDRVTSATVGAGMLHHALRRSQNVHRQATDIDPAARAVAMGHPGTVLWFTGLSGAGKSTIANLVERRLHALGCHCTLLDGDNLRHGLNRDLGFTEADRVENVRRVAEVARLMTDAGLIVLVALISPFRAEREAARRLVDDGAFVEVHVDIALEAAEARDVKGLYAKARRGELAHFTGIDSPYEAPERPELHIDAAGITAQDAADAVVQRLRELRRLR